MPADLARKAEKLNLYVLWFRHGLGLAIVLGLAAYQGFSHSQIGLTLRGWQPNALIGIGASALQLGFQRLFWRPYPLFNDNHKHLAAEPRANWILSQLFSVFAEELWLAFCVVSLIRAGHSSLLAILLPATVFGALHYPYRAGAIGTGVNGAISASLFLWRGSLLPSYLFHYMGNIACLYWACRGTASARRKSLGRTTLN